MPRPLTVSSNDALLYVVLVLAVLSLVHIAFGGRNTDMASAGC